ncbi:DUF927 domain-containing protein [Phreatobacter stygius]|uniref:DUF927 domain-containing protein n=1 Tax=Phreatobacter stygius TaxID=1940610 RepID=A0A4D7BEH7_9HYPH|nr:DUF927 domain-containing protein [Phreatobacter stygius]QCI68853.1 DUF927 domain-containing protein [Phreatobacter stygius]
MTKRIKDRSGSGSVPPKGDGESPAHDRLAEIAALIEADDPSDEGLPVTSSPSLAVGAFDAAEGATKTDGAPSAAPVASPGPSSALGTGLRKDDVVWPWGFAMRADGLYWAPPTTPQESQRISAPFEVRGLGRSEDGEHWCTVIRFADPDGGSHDIVIGHADLAGDGAEVRRRCSDGGLWISTARGARERFAAALAGCSTGRRVLLASRLGWHQAGDLFVLPDGSIRLDGRDAVHFEGARGTHFGQSGALDSWKQEVAALAVGQDRLLLSLGVSLSGPVLAPLGLDGGGVHLFGSSSVGKTSALLMGGSVWGGGGPLGFGQLWRITANAQEGIAAAHNDCLLALDEVGTCPPAELEAASYVLAGGQGKARMRSDATLKPRQRWRIAILSTGEVTLRSRIAEGRAQVRGKAGQEARIIDLPADAEKGFGLFDHAGPDGDPASLSKRIKGATSKHYGTAGPAFIRAFLEDREPATKALVGLLAKFKREHVPQSADGQVGRVAERFAVAAAAGELAISFGVLPFDAGAMEGACGRLLAVWIKRRGGVGSSEAREAVSNVRRFLQAHHMARFARDDRDESWRAQNLAGSKTAAGEDQVFYFFDSGWAEAIGGIDPRTAADALAAAGFLIRGSDGRRKCQRRVNGVLQRVYGVKATIFEGEEDA